MSFSSLTKNRPFQTNLLSFLGEYKPEMAYDYLTEHYLIQRQMALKDK